MYLVFQANNILEAHIVAGMLKNNGIDCHVGGHYLQGAVGDLPATDFAHVFVDDADIKMAEQLIKDYENDTL
ncbi:putative signal transducing protein [Methylophaga sp.]|uniref:putative signal transducing protein n=1 Tax=Methylophaga sp. TaxID=2024840 RepID=UPI003F6A1571